MQLACEANVVYVLCVLNARWNWHLHLLFKYKILRLA